MAYPPSSSAVSTLTQRNAPFKSPVPGSNAPAGTFLPGTKVQVGSLRVVIEKYLSEGGFAHVYVVRVPRDDHKHELAVLKRVAVPDREHLANMRTEVETMKKLKGHKKVVTYIDSHASQLKGGGYEVFLLMEYCSGGGLIDFMNTRLQHRLTEPEILKIFGDVAEGVACMHYLKPPLLHRDLKVENVLISKSASSGSPTYKLCDFGSAAPPRPAAKTAEEGRLIEDDVQKHTTMQYRSPEMIDVWRKQPIDEKADIWALGVFLYKLCYYTTPFEAAGQMAILNASFKYPAYPSFSDRLKKLIGSMLKEDPKQRPNIYQTIKAVCGMRNVEVPLKDIYAQRSQSEARRNESLPTAEPPMSIGLQKEAPKVQVQSVPDVTPMRRGRPTTAPTQRALAASNNPSPSPARGDPFAALDSKNYDVRAGAVDELSKKYPSLEEFSITQEKGGKFDFPTRVESLPQKRGSEVPNAAAAAVAAKGGDLNERVTNALADQVFTQSTAPKAAGVQKSHSIAQVEASQMTPVKSSVQAKVREISQNTSLVHQPTPVKTGNAKYASTGTGTSPPTSSTTVTAKKQFPDISSRPIWKVPAQDRSSSQPRASEPSQVAAAALQPKPRVQSPTSSRPSLEGHRPSQLEFEGPSLHRARSAGQHRQRPSSAYVSSNLDYLRDQESSKKRPSLEGRRHSQQERQASNDETAIDDDMDYLRNNEDAERRRTSGHHSSHHHVPSLTNHKKSGSLSGAKQMLAGRFGDAFKRFERSNSSGDEKKARNASRRHTHDEVEPPLLSPIEGSVGLTTPSKHSDSDSTVDETEDLPPDMRREMERRRLEQEERRVEEAAAEYRSRVTAQGSGGNTGSGVPTKASTIQKRVQSLLDEASQPSVQSRRTAEGYGRYTDEPFETVDVQREKTVPPPVVATKPSGSAIGSSYPTTRQQQMPPSDPPTPSLPIPPASAPPAQATLPQSRAVPRPSVPPKSPSLRTGGNTGTKPQWPPPSQGDDRGPPELSKSGGLAALLAKDLEGVPDYSTPKSSGKVENPVASVTSPNSQDPNGVYDDVEADFGKRYPSLSAIEMVETEIGGQRRTLRAREV